MTNMRPNEAGSEGAVKAKHPDAWQSGTGHVWEYRSVKKDYPMSEPLGNSWENAAKNIESTEVTP